MNTNENPIVFRRREIIGIPDQSEPDVTFHQEALEQALGYFDNKIDDSEHFGYLLGKRVPSPNGASRISIEKVFFPENAATNSTVMSVGVDMEKAMALLEEETRNSGLEFVGSIHSQPAWGADWITDDFDIPMFDTLEKVARFRFGISNPESMIHAVYDPGSKQKRRDETVKRFSIWSKNGKAIATDIGRKERDSKTGKHGENTNYTEVLI